MSDQFNGFHITDSTLHKILFKIQQQIKMDHGPKVKVPYHLILKYYLLKSADYAEANEDSLAFLNMIQSEINKSVDENYLKLEEILDKIR